MIRTQIPDADQTFLQAWAVAVHFCDGDPVALNRLSIQAAHRDEIIRLWDGMDGMARARVRASGSRHYPLYADGTGIFLTTSRQGRCQVVTGRQISLPEYLQIKALVRDGIPGLVREDETA